MKQLPVKPELAKTIIELVAGSYNVVRSQIAKSLGVSKSTAERATQSMIDASLLCEENGEGARQGRGGIRIAIHPQAPCAIGINLEPGEVRAIAVDLGGRTIDTTGTPILADVESESILASIDACIGKLIGKVKRLNREILGIGFGDPGLVDLEKGTTLFCSNLPQWKSVPIERHLKEKYGLAINKAHNTSRIKCLAEAKYGVAKGVEGFLFLDLGPGIGMGAFTKGNLYLGEGGQGCEIGHTVMDPNGPICACGNQGCLEAIAGGQSMGRLAKEWMSKGVQSSLLELAGGHEKEIRAEHIFQASEEGDRLAGTLMETARKALGIAIGNACNLFHPRMVVLGGDVAQPERVWKALPDLIRRAAIPFIAKDLQVEFSTLGNRAGVLGAAEMVFLEAFSQGVEPAPLRYFRSKPSTPTRQKRIGKLKK